MLVVRCEPEDMVRMVVLNLKGGEGGGGGHLGFRTAIDKKYIE